MRDITKAEMDVVLTLVKSPEVVYNSNSLAKVIGITSMGALKILKRLERETIVKSKRFGRAIAYKINIEGAYSRKYLSLLFARESLYANPKTRKWINELKRIKNADLIIIFGSVLERPNPNDIDVLIVTDKKRFSKLQIEIKELNELNIKRVHPIYQTFEDLIKNIKNRDKPILNAIKGILIKGEERFLEVYNESRKE